MTFALVGLLAASTTLVSSASATTGRVTPKLQASSHTITLGITNDDAGNGFDLPLFADGFAAWVKAVDAAGGIDGYKILTVRCNDQGDAAGTQTCARQVINNKKVVGDMGFEAYSVVDEPLFQAAGLSFIHPYPVGGSDYSESTLTINAGTLGAYALLPFWLSENRHVTKIAVIRTGVTDTLDVPQLVKAACAASGRCKLVADIPYPIGTSDFSSYVLQAEAAKAQAIVVGAQLADIVRIFQGGQSVGFNGVWGIPGVSNIPSVHTAANKSGATVYAEADYPNIAGNTPGMAAYRTAMTKAGFADEISQSSLGSYAVGLVYGAAIKAIGASKVTRASLHNFLLHKNLLNVTLEPPVLGRSQAPKNPNFAAVGTSSAYVTVLNKKSSTAVNYITGLESFKAVLAKITGALGG
jgi:ABC-type branched-subunit amino acid transport system substrate-binding protein